MIRKRFGLREWQLRGSFQAPCPTASVPSSPRRAQVAPEPLLQTPGDISTSARAALGQPRPQQTTPSPFSAATPATAGVVWGESRVGSQPHPPRTRLSHCPQIITHGAAGGAASESACMIPELGGAGAGDPGDRLLTLPSDPPGRLPPRDLTLRRPCAAALTMPSCPPWRPLLLLSLWGPLLQRAEVRIHGATGVQGLEGGLGLVLSLPPLQRGGRLSRLSRFKFRWLFPIPLLSFANPLDDFQPPLPLLFLKVFSPPPPCPVTPLVVSRHPSRVRRGFSATQDSRANRTAPPSPSRASGPHKPCSLGAEVGRGWGVLPSLFP